MDEFEYIEAAQLAINSMIDGSMNTVGVTFAYIVAAYLAGQNLTKSAAVGLTILYTLFIVSPISGVLGATRSYVLTIERYHQVFPDGWAFGAPPGLFELGVINIGPLALGWLGSLFYLHFYVRKGI
ncbi:MAG: hypothetical protein PsegKO_07080 [Pseudohongiellaceae bacterium]